MTAIKINARARRTAAVTAAVLALSVPGCSRDSLLEVETPDIIDPGALDNPQGIAALHAGAVSEFVFQMHNVAGLALYAALFTNESMHASTPPAVREWDLRNVLASNTVADDVFLNLQRARARFGGAVGEWMHSSLATICG